MAAEQSGRRLHFGLSALLFGQAAAATIAHCDAMRAMGARPMPGGWWLTPGWTPYCGESWGELAASFLVMWTVMMAAMMLPSLSPLLWRYRRAMDDGDAARAGIATLLVGIGYFLVWIGLGSAIFPIVALLAAGATQEPSLARATPLAAGLVVFLAGALQFTAWKTRHLDICRRAGPLALCHGSPAPQAALTQGLALGYSCANACAGSLAALLAMGLMNLPAMMMVTLAVTAERLAPQVGIVRRLLGAAGIAAGLAMIARTLGAA